MTTNTTTTISDLSNALRARNALIWIVTPEEERAEKGISEAAMAASYVPLFWDCATGLSEIDGRVVDASVTDPAAVLTAIRAERERRVFVLRDFHKWIADPTVNRGLRTLTRSIKSAARENARAVVVLSPSSEVPPELQGDALVIEWPLPSREEIAALLDAAIERLPEEVRSAAAPNGTRDAAIDAAVGLTAQAALACYGKSLVATRKIDARTVAAEKKSVISKVKGVEWIDPIPGGLDAVGGLDGLKNWLSVRRSAFTPAARAFGLPAPKGAMLVGVPGCGKSLTGKAISTAWGMPLLKIDLGAVKGKFVGESEAGLRSVLKVAETVAPCVVWIDEIEKALAGATQGAADGGVSADALGTILSWMQDRQGSVFVIATANDVSKLPPELLRKGRFDEVFFVDLPNADERRAILATAMKAHGRDVTTVDAAAVATATDGFTGSEIAALVPDALFVAFNDGARAITTADLVAAAKSVVPLSKTASEKITALREWAKTRARPASIASATESKGVAGGLDL